MGQPAYMVYSKPVKGSSVEKRFFIKYEVKVAESVEDNPRNLLVMPENILKYLPSYKHIQKAAWWLSVDNYSGARKGKCSLFRYLLRTALDKYLSLYDKQWEHYVQSEYARLYVVNERHITQTSVYNLSDYLNSEFIENLMRSSKLYIDFGNHPGKDRMPREAAICGCCIITGKRGAAANDVDIKIPSQYKISDSDISLIADRIKYVLKNYEDLTSDFDSYRDKIRHEEAVFDAEIKRIFID